MMMQIGKLPFEQGCYIKFNPDFTVLHFDLEIEIGVEWNTHVGTAV